eukprot:378272-Rhodomonas_salina.2
MYGLLISASGGATRSAPCIVPSGYSPPRRYLGPIYSKGRTKGVAQQPASSLLPDAKQNWSRKSALLRDAAVSQQCFSAISQQCLRLQPPLPQVLSDPLLLLHLSFGVPTEQEC